MTQLKNHKIFDDYSKLVVNNKQNLSIKIYKGVLLTFLFIAWLTILVTARQSIFLEQLIHPRYFLQFEDLQNEHFNMIIVFRFIILSFIFFYSIVKNYKNLHFQNEAIKNYVYWFVIFFAQSIAAFGLLLGFHPDKSSKSLAMEYASLIYILIPLVLSNVAYELYLFFIKRKTEPLIYNKVWSLVLTVIAQTISLALVIAFVISFTKGAKTVQHNLDIEALRLKNKNTPIIPEFLLFDNDMYTFLKQLFVVSSSSNVAIIIFGLIGIGVLLVSMNINKILFIIAKQYTWRFFKDQIIITIAVFFAMLLWFIQVLSLKAQEETIIGTNEQNNFAYLSHLIIVAIVLSAYLAMSFVKQLKNKSDATRTLYYAIAQTVLWTSSLIFDFAAKNYFVDALNVFFSASAGFIMLLVYLLNKKTTPNFAMAFMIISTITMILVLFSTGANSLLIKEKNYALANINANMEFAQVFIVLNLVAFASYLFASIINLKYVLFKVAQIKMTKKVVEHEIK